MSDEVSRNVPRRARPALRSFSCAMVICTCCQKRSRRMRSSIILPTSRQRSTGSIERGSANHLEASIEKSGSRAVRMMRRESLGFQHEQNDVALSSYSREPRARAPVRGRSAEKTPSRIQGTPGSDRSRASRHRVKRPHKKSQVL